MTGLLDDTTLGSPSSTSGALSVASINNSQLAATVAKASWTGGDLTFGYQQQVGAFDGTPHQIVACGLGKPGECPAEVRGNIALILRGDISFADKFKTAQAAGAIGVIIYNNATDGDTLMGMAGIDKSPIPGYFIFHSVGVKLAEQLKNGPISVTFTKDMMLLPNTNPVQPSDFTSWGGTPDLGFKPQLAGIGGSVYSTLNDNTYGNMSGTSMATPHVAGVVAIGLQEYQKRFPTMSAVERDTTLRTALSNTAKILKHGEIPFAPRQMGAGLVQTKDALTTNVFATVDGEPAVALKQVNGPRTFTVTLTNKGTTDASFALGGTCVVAETRDAKGNDITACSTTDTFAAGAQNVTVPANGTATATFTLTPDMSSQHWIQGWATLTSTTASQPSLVVPYLGFAGDWNKEKIIDTPRGQGTPLMDELFGPEQKNLTQLWASYLNYSPASRVGAKAWISPNGDGYFDAVMSSAMLLRSAKTMDFKILDANGKELRDLGTDEDAQRTLLSKTPAKDGTAAWMATTHQWDGTLYNPSTDKFEPAADGKYIFRVMARLSEDMDWQQVDMPFGIDRVAPTTTTTVAGPGADGKYTVTLKIADDRAGIDLDSLLVSSPDFNTRWTRDGGTLVKVDDSTYTFVVNATATPQVDIRLRDNAGNLTRSSVLVGPAKVAFTQQGLDRPIDKTTLGDGTTIPLWHNGNVTLTGTVSSTITKATLNGNPVELKNGQFSVEVPAADGKRTDFTLVGFDASGAEVAKATSFVVIDNQAPVITIDSTVPARDADGRLVLAADGSVTISGTITDNIATTKDAVSNLVGFTDSVDITIDPDGKHFTVKVTPNPTDGFVALYAADYLNLNSGQSLHITTTKLPLARAVANPGALKLTYDDPQLNATQNDPQLPPLNFGAAHYFVNGGFKGLKSEGGATDLHMTGTFNAKPGSFTVNGKPVTVKPDLSVDIPVTLAEGITKVPYEVRDAADKLVVASEWRFFYDKTLPEYTLDKPQVAEDGAIYAKTAGESIDVAGTVWDNAFGYVASLNGTVIKDFFNMWDPGASINKRDFTGKVTAKDGDMVRWAMYDQTGNGFERHIPIIVDGQAPALVIDGAKDGDIIPTTQKIVVKSSDAHLRNLSVTVDGKPVQVLSTAVVIDPRVAVDKYNPNAPAGSAPVALTAAATPVASTDLVVEIPALGAGRHAIAASSQDRAGNTATATALVTVSDAPVIAGPDTITINPDDGDALAQLQRAYTVTDATQAQPVIQVQADLTGLQLDVPTPITLTATNAVGQRTTKAITVLWQRPLTTQTSGCGSMTARFARGDVLTITCTPKADGNTAVSLSGLRVPVAGAVTINGVAGNVYQTDAQGAVTAKLNATAVSGGVQFEGQAPGSYIIGHVAAGDTLPPPTGMGGNANDGSTQTLDAQDLSDTGVPAVALLALALGLAAITAGGVVVTRKK